VAAGRANRLDLTGDDPEKAIWRKAVLSNLSLSEANIPTWQVFRKPIPLAAMQETADPFDPQDRIQKRTNGSISTLQTILMTR
jgi:hypothetical protein